MSNMSFLNTPGHLGHGTKLTGINFHFSATKIFYMVFGLKKSTVFEKKKDLSLKIE